LEETDVGFDYVGGKPTVGEVLCQALEFDLFNQLSILIVIHHNMVKYTDLFETLKRGRGLIGLADLWGGNVTGETLRCGKLLDEQLPDLWLFKNTL
jgi:hypothetical protein